LKKSDQDAQSINLRKSSFSN